MIKNFYTMKENYSTISKKLLLSGFFRLSIKKVSKALGFVLFFSLMTQLSIAQTEISWTGTVSSDASNSFNWNPQLTPPGNIIYIDSAYKFTNLPVYNVENSISIYQILNEYTSKFEINVAKDSIVDVNGSSSAHLYPHGRMTKGGEGTLSFRANIYFENIADTLVITDGTVDCRSSLLMGTKTLTAGGYMEISGNGVFLSKGAWPPGRFATDSLQSVITITDNGRLEVISSKTPDWSADAQYLADRNQIKSSPDRDIIVKYSLEQNKTIVYSRSKMAFVVEPDMDQNIVANEDGEILRIAKNDGLASMTSLAWKYSTTSGSGYVDFPTTQNGDTLVPNFVDPGVFYVVCIGDNGTTTDTTNEVKFLVSSDKVSIAPEGKQSLRIGQVPYTLTVTEEVTVDSRDWLYTTTPGSGYQSFDPAQTGVTCSPIFDEVGDYFVICKSAIGNVDHQSNEVAISFSDSTGYSDIHWRGTYSEEGADIRNWWPHSYLYRANILLDTTEYDVDPVINTVGDVFIGSLGIPAGAKLTIDLPNNLDTITRSSSVNSGSDYISGTVHIKSGVYKVNTYQHFLNPTTLLDIEGGAYVQSNYTLLLGEKYLTYGGTVNVHGTGLLYANSIGRFSTDTTQSVITVWDEGKIVLVGDQTADVTAWIAKNQLKTLENWELVVVYDSGEDITIVTAFDPYAITVEPLTAQILYASELGDKLSALNTGIYDSLVWKYSTTYDGELMEIAPQANGDTLIPVFSVPGDYYVICVGINDTITKKSNKIHIIIPEVNVTPTEKQTININGESVNMSVAETPASTSRLWKYSTTAGGPYNTTTGGISTETYQIIFPTTGTKYIVCESVFKEGNTTKTIISNEVEVEIVELSINPDNNQTIVVNTDGTTISAVEDGAVDSREWLVSTTPGSGYASFDPKETDVDYTPNFASVGTYYVVCASVFSGLTIQSDEVKITVNSNTGISNHSVNTLALYPNPTSGTFIINEENISSYRVNVYNTLGKLVVSKEFNNVSGPQELSLDTKGIYLINLVTDNQVKTSRLIVE